jgi:multidrug efflux pump subunit AcrA (membrane-fusion protein)
MARGRGAGREVVELELREARAQLAELEAEVGGAVIRAPAAGVIVRPPADKENAGGQIHVGQTLTKGQLIGSIARTGGLAVSFQLSETDADAVRPGMGVSVTGPGFGGAAIDGKVTSVAGEASPSSGAGGPLATFAATARLDPLTPDQTRTVRIGMTANVTVATYSAKRALTVPPAAVHGAAPDATVEVKGPFGRRSVRVRLGHVGPDGVEILSGLNPGDTVVWTAPPPGG